MPSREFIVPRGNVARNWFGYAPKKLGKHENVAYGQHVKSWTRRFISFLTPRDLWDSTGGEEKWRKKWRGGGDLDRRTANGRPTARRTTGRPPRRKLLLTTPHYAQRAACSTVLTLGTEFSRPFAKLHLADRNDDAH